MKIFKRLSLRNREADPASFEALYEAVVVRKIRARYTANAENAILRKALAGNRTEFEAFNVYVEQCKTEAKTELGIQ